MKNKKRIKNNANELYNICYQKEKLILIKEIFFITEGINEIIENENCMDIIQLILNQQDFIFCDVQDWYIEREDNELFNIICKDSLKEVTLIMNNIIIDFYFDSLHIVIKNNTVCLPIEFDFYFNS
ncbi:hypothetical protein NZD88_20690 [Chryseobacterium antibioticum]|uniref:DUF6876 domain-containing protein n=1 Tax=Chryseobacterium pyrolae TaxID=2987481 RepID=A0ABT2IMV2_9FLAO|nr:DUF6876 family protein [Chryseobacterium pyrolae]MCT2409980.1 hypothetical protein [Chryseobacterium pyrolae]